MIPFHLDLPPIYKGCTWPAILLSWKTPNGQPMSLSGWTPFCTTRHFSLNAVVVDAVKGVTRLSLTRNQTRLLKLGVEQWDWIWLNHFTTEILVPHLAGRIEIRQSLAPTVSP